MSSERVTVADPPETPPDVVLERPPWKGRFPGFSNKFAVFSAILLPLFVGLAFLIARKPGASRNGPPLSAQRPAAARTLRLKGTTEAIESRAILAPVLSGQQVGSLTITKLVPAGIRVKRGDLLVEFDRQAQVREFLDKQAEYDKLIGQVSEQQAKENAVRAKDETELHQAGSDLRNAELEIKKAELMSRIDVEKAQLSLDQAKATLAQLKETFDLKRNAGQAATRILEIQRDRTRLIMQNAQTNAESMQIRAPLDGVVVLNTIWKNGRIGEVQEGEQVRPGVPFMRVVNPSGMQVQVPVNQQDLLGLHIGQTAKVRIDAYPELVLPAKLEQIAPVGRGGDFSAKVRTFSAIFSIQGNDAKLMPDLSAAVDVLSDTLGQAASVRPSTRPGTRE
jgi:HlyD family secretion protein